MSVITFVVNEGDHIFDNRPVHGNAVLGDKGIDFKVAAKEVNGIDRVPNQDCAKI